MTRTRWSWMHGHEDMYKQVGHRLREARLDLGLRLCDIELLTGIWASQLSNMENGKAMPKLHELMILTKAYNIKLEDLLADLPL